MGSRIYQTNSHEETVLLGKQLGERVSSGMVIALFGDLGSGKTTFVQGLAKGLGVPEDYYVTSPSYTIINEYPGKFRLFHVDLYRISDPVELEDLGFDEIIDSPSIVAIEWPERLPGDYLPAYLAVVFETVDADTRKISMKGYGLDTPDLIGEMQKVLKE